MSRSAAALSAPSRPTRRPVDFACPAAGLAGEAEIRFNHLDEMEQVLGGFVGAQKVVPLTRRGDSGGAFAFQGTAKIGVLDIRFSRGMELHFAPADIHDETRNISFITSSKGSGQLLLGRTETEFGQRSGAVFNSDHSRSLQFQEDCETRTVVLSYGGVAEHCAKLLGRELDQTLLFRADFDLDAAAGQSWLRAVHYAASEFGNPYSLVRNVPAARQQIEQMLLTTLLLGHENNHSEALLRPQSAAAPFYVKRAEAFIEAHFTEPLSTADIAAHAGVSARSLQNGFQRYRGTTPMNFLRHVRLHRVHEALLAADPSVAMVTEVALSCGFGHMGEFGALYKRTFGVTPRETLWKGRRG